jgi:excisionase family DNA binding protein
MRPDPPTEAREPPGRLLTARQVADRLGVSAETILRWTRRGQLPAFRLPGGALRYRDVDLADWLAEKATSCPEPVGEPAAGARNLAEATNDRRRKGDRDAADPARRGIQARLW